MTRSSDLDIIAPDDPVIETPRKSKLIEENKKKIFTKYNSNKEYKDNDTHKEVREILGHTTSPLSPILVFPDHFSFVEKNDDEVIYAVLRPHWFTNISWILLSILMLIAPILLNFFPISLDISSNILYIITLFWYLITFSFSLEKFISWYFDLSIITDNRVIDIDVKNLLDRNYTEAQIKKIQDISYKVTGVSQTFFNYGSVKIQTAGENPNIEFEKIAFPDKITKLLERLYQNVTSHK